MRIVQLQRGVERRQEEKAPCKEAAERLKGVDAPSWQVLLHGCLACRAPLASGKKRLRQEADCIRVASDSSLFANPAAHLFSRILPRRDGRRVGGEAVVEHGAMGVDCGFWNGETGAL
jgi:hypothetical protein